MLSLVLHLDEYYKTILKSQNNVETDSSTVDNNQNKNIEVSIERTIENGEDLTNVVIKGEGDVTRKELEEELDENA